MEASLYVYSAIIYCVLTGYFFQCVTSQQSIPVSLSSSLNDQHEVHRGEDITFQCTTRGSSTLAWSSNEYIGHCIEFSVHDMIGERNVPNSFTSAELLNVYDDENGRQVIESQLTISVQRSIPHSSVSCHHKRAQPLTLNFQLSDIPLLMSSGGNMCPGEFWNFTCEIRDSSILAWEIQNDQYIGPRGSRLEFLSAEPVGTVKYSEINSGVFANLTKNYLQNGVQVLTCELSISELLYHPDDVEVLCVNVGLDTENTYRLTVNYNCDYTRAGDNPLTTGAKETTSISNDAISIKNGSPLSLWWLFVWCLMLQHCTQDMRGFI